MANNFKWVNATTLDGVFWDNGTLFSAAPITQIGTLTIERRKSVGSDKVLDAQLNNTGNIVASFDSNSFQNTLVAFADGAILNNSGSFELQSGAFGNVRGEIGTFNNSGTLRKTTVGNGGFGVTFNNTGTVNVESGILTIEGGGVSDGGTFNITSGKTLKFAGSSLGLYTLSNGSKINGNGNLILGSGGIFDLKISEGAAIANTVQFTVESSQTFIDQPSGFQVDQDWTLPTTTKWNGGLFKSTGILTNKGSLTIGGGQRKFFNAQLNNTGNIVGNFKNEILPGIYNLIFQVGSVLNNFGNFKLQAGTTGFLDGAIFNNYGNFELQEASIRAIGEFPNFSVGTFNNFGTLKKTTALFGGTGWIGVDFNNKGTVNVESGILELGGGVSDGGIFNLTRGKTLSFNRGVYTLSNGTKINGNGNLTVGAGQVLLKVSEGATIANTVKFTLSGIGEFRVDGDWTLPTTTDWIFGTFKSTGILTNSGNLNLIGGGVRYLDAQLNNTGNIFHDRDNLNFLDGAILNNFGNYEIQAIATRTVSINAGGTFNNFGTYKKTLSGSSGMGSDFNNTGTVEARSGTIDFLRAYTHNNANLILSGGNFIFRRALTINSGSIEGNGSIDVKDFEDIGMTNSGLLNPRLASNTEFGRLTINNSYTETDNARINIQLGGNTAGINFDQIDINGKAAFDGTLNVSLLNGWRC